MSMGSAPRVAIRVDASTAMGTGHLRRCQSLAAALAEAGAQVLFVCRRLDGVSPRLLSTSGALLRWLPEPSSDFAAAPDAPAHAAWAAVGQDLDACQTMRALGDWRPDWVVVDHYAFDARWHGAIREGLGCRVLVIDDLADRAIDADALLDHNWRDDHRSCYAMRLQREPLWLCGTRFALLAPAYRAAPGYVFSESVRSIGIFMGGTDPTGVSALALAATRAAGFQGPVEVVSTSASANIEALSEACLADGRCTLTLDAPDLAAFFARHDLQIGAGGGATWERCCIGVPTVAVTVAANQTAVVSELAARGALGAADLATLSTVLRQTITDSSLRRSYCERSKALVDGRGSHRAALTLLREWLTLRPAAVSDARLLHGWRNHPAVRAVSIQKESIDFEAHLRWLKSALSSPGRWLFVATVGQLAVGSIRFDEVGDDACEVSLYTDPALRGLGLGHFMLAAGERALLAQRPIGFSSLARVQPDNLASRRMFESSGYIGGPLVYRKWVAPSSDLEPGIS